MAKATVTATGAPVSYKDPYWVDMAVKAGKEVGLPEGLLPAILLKGERTNADLVSSAGAKTPFQIIPQTRAGLLKLHGVDAYADDYSAAKAAALLLKGSLDNNKGDVGLAVSEYHGGPNRKLWGPINRDYRARVTGVSELGGTGLSVFAPVKGYAPTTSTNATTSVKSTAPSVVKESAGDALDKFYSANKASFTAAPAEEYNPSTALNKFYEDNKIPKDGSTKVQVKDAIRTSFEPSAEAKAGSVATNKLIEDAKSSPAPAIDSAQVAYDNFIQGKFSPEVRAQYVAAINSGKATLPPGTSLGPEGVVTPVGNTAPVDSSKAAWTNYLQGRFSPGVRKEYEDAVLSGKATLPPGESLFTEMNDSKFGSASPTTWGGIMKMSNEISDITDRNRGSSFITAPKPADGVGVWDATKGIFESALSLGSSMTTGLAGGIGGAIGNTAGAIVEGLRGDNRGDALDRIGQGTAEGMSKLTYSPRTYAGQVINDRAIETASQVPFLPEASLASTTMRAGGALGKNAVIGGALTKTGDVLQKGGALAKEKIPIIAKPIETFIVNPSKKIVDVVSNPLGRKDYQAPRMTREELNNVPYQEHLANSKELNKNAKELPHPVNLTRGEIYGANTQMRVEKDLSKKEVAGKSLRENSYKNQEALIKNITTQDKAVKGLEVVPEEALTEVGSTAIKSGIEHVLKKEGDGIANKTSLRTQVDNARNEVTDPHLTPVIEVPKVALTNAVKSIPNGPLLSNAVRTGVLQDISEMSHPTLPGMTTIGDTIKLVGKVSEGGSHASPVIHDALLKALSGATTDGRVKAYIEASRRHADYVPYSSGISAEGKAILKEGSPSKVADFLLRDGSNSDVNAFKKIMLKHEDIPAVEARGEELLNKIAENRNKLSEGNITLAERNRVTEEIKTLTKKHEVLQPHIEAMKRFKGEDYLFNSSLPSTYGPATQLYNWEGVKKGLLLDLAKASSENVAGKVSMKSSSFSEALNKIGNERLKLIFGKEKAGLLRHIERISNHSRLLNVSAPAQVKLGELLAKHWGSLGIDILKYKLVSGPLAAPMAVVGKYLQHRRNLNIEAARIRDAVTHADTLRNAGSGVVSRTLKDKVLDKYHLVNGLGRYTALKSKIDERKERRKAITEQRVKNYKRKTGQQ